MADVKDILGVARAGTPADKPKDDKPKKEKMKRPEGMSREAFALLGDSHPIISTHFAGGLKKKDMKTKPKPSTKGILTWQWKSFKNSARADGLDLFRWVKGYKDAAGRLKEQEEEDYFYAKFNKKVHMYKFNDEEWSNLLEAESGDWSKAETQYLLDLCDRFDLRFPVIADRYEYEGGHARTMEDLKERYYSVARRLLIAREGGEAAVANQTLVKYPFNKQHETERKRAVHLLLTRNAKQVAEENAILAEARQIEERRKAEAGNTAFAARRASTAITPAAAASRQPGRSAVPTPATTPGSASLAPPVLAGAPSGGLPGPFSHQYTTGPLGAGDYKYPLDFPNHTVPPVPSLFDVHMQPWKPPKPGVYMRGSHTQSIAQAMASAMVGGARAFKSVEQTLSELGWPGALTGPKMGSRATCGSWLALRGEVIAMHELKRNLQNRSFADDRTRRPTTKRR